MMGPLRLGDGIAFMCEMNSGLALPSQHHALRGTGVWGRKGRNPGHPWAMPKESWDVSQM